MRNIIKMKIPVSRPTLVVNSKRPLALFKYEALLATKLQFTSVKVRNISTIYYGQLFSNTSSPSRLQNNLARDNEDKINKFSLENTDKFYSYRVECHKQEQFLSTQLQIQNNKPDQTKNEDWDEIKSLVFKMPGNLNDKNIDAIIMNKCAELKFLPLGKSYFKYLKDVKKPINRATYGSYLRLFYSCRSDCDSDDLNEVVRLYKELLEVYPTLDSYTAEKAICALSITKEWKEYEKLFIAIKQFYHPSVFVYQIVILTAFDHQEFDLGWKLIEEMQYQELRIPEEIFLYWFQKVQFRMLEEDLLRVLKFINYFNIKPSDKLCKVIKKAFEEYYKKGKVMFTRIARTGECRSCHSKLEPSHVSQEDFDELKKEFLNPLLVGRDIFQKTKPEEFKQFLNFLEKSAPFDIVIDGLNVSMGGKSRTVNDNTYRLKSVVKHFVTLNKKRILVLGRKHMASWSTPHMEYVCGNANLFLTDNLSQDDPFMLYAALYSGLGTYFVSADLMRGHKFLLANPKLQTTFLKWQSMRQYFIASIGTYERVYFEEPVSFLQTTQQNSKGDWHIPYIVIGEELSNRDKVDHLHRHWMCLQKDATEAIRGPNKPNEPHVKRGKEWENSKPLKQPAGKINLKKIFMEDDLR